MLARDGVSRRGARAGRDRVAAGPPDAGL